MTASRTHKNVIIMNAKGDLGMTMKQEFTCDLCECNISSGEGMGIRSPGLLNNLRLIELSEALKHLCWKCLDGTADAVTIRREKGLSITDFPDHDTPTVIKEEPVMLTSEPLLLDKKMIKQ